MNVWKKTAVVGISGVMVLTTAIPAWAGQWQFDGPEVWQWKYVEDDGTYPVDSWKEIGGKWYHLDKNGYRDIGWQIYLETDTYLNSDGSTYTQDVHRWYHFNDDGVMDTQGEWEGGFIQENGAFLVDSSVYSGGVVMYWRHLPIKNEAGVITGETDGRLYWGTIPWVTEFAKQWYEVTWNNDGVKIGDWKMDYQLPENWWDECPNPVLNALISSSLGGADDGTYSWRDWYVDENNVLHVAASVEYNTAYISNPELLPNKKYDRAVGVWIVQ